ncbi:RNA polymerase sigma factor [Chitinophaga sp. 22620]|uniref:RNA polymerase sigma factor n=1 Tax=Chitinophaga sp. 22620 TaxID=3453952 RepID=UPI003F831C82
MMNEEVLHQYFRQVCDNGDQDAYNELYKGLCSRLIHFSAAITGSWQLAEEIVSDVFIMLWHKRAQLAGVANPTVYLYVCTRNQSINALRQQRRHQHMSLDNLDTEAFAISPDTEQNMLSAEVIQKIESAIRSLPARCQLIFRLVKQDGLKYKEVGELLQISPKTVDAQLAIAVKKIAEAIRLDMTADMAQSYLFR